MCQLPTQTSLVILLHNFRECGQQVDTMKYNWTSFLFNVCLGKVKNPADSTDIVADSLMATAWWMTCFWLHWELVLFEPSLHSMVALWHALGMAKSSVHPRLVPRSCQLRAIPVPARERRKGSHGIRSMRYSYTQPFLWHSRSNMIQPSPEHPDHSPPAKDQASKHHGGSGSKWIQASWASWDREIDGTRWYNVINVLLHHDHLIIYINIRYMIWCWYMLIWYKL